MQYSSITSNYFNRHFIGILVQMRIADKGTRFGNYIVDKIAFIGIIILHAFTLDGLHLIPANGSPLLAFYFFVLYVLYHFVFEYYFSRTPGKFLTKTKVVSVDGARPGAKVLFTRNICRLIPFDSLSFLFAENGWHDAISKTVVVHSEKP